MGFSGGGGGQTLPHKHTNIANDGSPLDMNNVTIGSLAAGSIPYSDGAALQELTIGAGATVLTSTAGVPTWASAGGVTIAQLQATLSADFLNAVLATWTTVDNGAGDNLIVSIPDGVNFIACCTACVNNWNYGSDCYMRFMEDGAAVLDSETEVSHDVGHQNGPVTATLFYQGSNTSGGAIDLEVQVYNANGSFRVYGDPVNRRNSTLWVTTIA